MTVWTILPLTFISDTRAPCALTAGERGQHAFNAGCMINGYVPVTFNELVENNLKFREQNTYDKEETQ